MTIKDNDFRVHMRHLRACGMCNREPRLFFRARGWSWDSFITEGIPAQRLIDDGDPMALLVVQVARHERDVALVKGLTSSEQ
jgi:hypothetical protein